LDAGGPGRLVLLAVFTGEVFAVLTVLAVFFAKICECRSILVASAFCSEVFIMREVAKSSTPARTEMLCFLGELTGFGPRLGDDVVERVASGAVANGLARGVL